MESKISFQVSKNELQKHLTKVSKAVRDKATLPIYTMFLFELLGEELKLTGTDTEIQIESTLPILETSGDLSFCVDKSIIDILKTLPEQPLTIEVSVIKVSDTLNRVEVNIIHSSGNVSTHGEESITYSKMRDVSGLSFEVKASKLKRGLDKTQKFAYGSIDKPAINSVYLDITPESMTFVGTDQIIVSRFRDSSVKVEGARSFILGIDSAKSLYTLIDSLGDELVKITNNPNNVSFESEYFKLTSRLYEGTYVNYNGPFPTSSPIQLKTNAKLLTNIVSRLLSVSPKESCLIRIESGMMQSYFTAKDVMLNKSANESIDCECNGEIKIGINGKRLLDMVGVIDDNVLLSFTAPNKPIIVSPEKQIEDCNLEILVMPIVLND